MLLLLANKWNLELRKHDLSFPGSGMVQVYYIFVQLVLIAKGRNACSGWLLLSTLKERGGGKGGGNERGGEGEGEGGRGSAALGE